MLNTGGSGERYGTAAGTCFFDIGPLRRAKGYTPFGTHLLSHRRPCPALFEPGDREALALALRSAKDAGVPLTLLGNGSNLLVSDAGVEGLVIKLGKAFSAISMAEDGRVFAMAGSLLSSLANFAADHGLMGIEWAEGIPGSVGGALAMNAGAYGGETKSAVSEVEYFDMESGALICRPLEEGRWATAGAPLPGRSG